MMISLILVTTLNAIQDSLFINPHCAHAVFKISTDREWLNPSEISSNGRGDSLEQRCLDVRKSKQEELSVNN